MAAYAAALSLTHIIDLLKNHPSPPISLDKKQLHSLTEIVTFLQEFLEGYVSPFSYRDEADPLEVRIVDAIYAAEDVIESYIVDTIHLAAAATTKQQHDEEDDDDDYDDDDDDEDDNHLAAASTTQNDDDDDVDDAMESYTVGIMQLAAAAAQHEDEQTRYFTFYEELQKLMEAMVLIKKEVEMEMEMVKEKEKEKEKAGVLEPEAGIFKSSSNERKIPMVGSDNVRIQLLDRLARGDSNRQIIPIVGMGGIGKTTLARNVVADKLILEHFDICLWGTVSQECNIAGTLSELLSRGRENSSGRSVGELGEELHKHLFGRRYLVVIDDIWTIEVWDKIRNFFPNCGKGSRIIVTTRMSNLASHLTSSSNSLCMSFLNEVDSWTLFSQTVPDLEPELREVGEKIVGKCKGLPLSIVVIGGLLAKSERTQGYWEYVEGNLSSIVNLDNEEYCLRVLKLSYNHLPAYLKPCFLYMGAFDEDSEIRISTIMKLWVSEGLVKPREKKKQNLESVAREYLHELVDRNLVMVHELKSSMDRVSSIRELGRVVDRINWCRMHDLVRDVCLREAQKQRFYYLYSEHNPSSHRHRRIVVPANTTRDYYGSRVILESSSCPRTYACYLDNAHRFLSFRLLRTLHTHTGGFRSACGYNQRKVLGLVNAWLLAITVIEGELRSSISRLWSLHTLIVYSRHVLKGPVEFWGMHQLMHVEFNGGGLRLRLPPPNDVVVLENLRTLVGMVDFHLNEDVATRMPDLAVLDVSYGGEGLNDREVHCLSYLRCLSKLESFRCFVKEKSGEFLRRICFPPSLKQIILLDRRRGSRRIELEDVLEKIGELPFVEELAIEGGVFRSRSWETIEGQLPRLRTLELKCCTSLEKWIVSDGSHFPLLRKLILERLGELEEIPSEIGEIATLESIELRHCSESVVVSAKRIVEEQEDLYGEDELSFRVLVVDENAAALESLASPNFQVELGKSNRA